MQLTQLGNAAKDFMSLIITNMLSRKTATVKQLYRVTNGKHANDLDCSGESVLPFFFFFPQLTDLWAETSTLVCHMKLNMKILSEANPKMRLQTSAILFSKRCF